ncbi:MAG: DNA translocase FtsK [Proteobacteria bacterium]|nr:DNA translocase FtsK [Pseudomonadota bacterium]
MAPRTDTERPARKGKKKPPAAKKTTRVGRGRSVLSRDAGAGRIRTSIQSLRRRQAAMGMDVGSLVGLGGALLLLLSVISYHPADTRVGNWGLVGDEAIIHNWIGPVGAWFAEWFILVLGLTAFVLPVLLGLFVVALAGRRSRMPRIVDVCGFVGVTMSIAMLVHLVFPDVPFRGNIIEGGGWIGDGLSGAFVTRLNPLGTAVVGLTAFLVSARLAFGVRFFGMVRELGDRLRGMLGLGAGVARHGLKKVGAGLGTAGRQAKDVLGDWQHERELRVEERRWEREERLARFEEERLEREAMDDADDGLEEGYAPLSDRAEAAVELDDSIGLDSAVQPPPGRRSRVRRPTKPEPPTPEPMEAPLDALAPTEAEGDVVQPVLMEPEPELEEMARVDSMRGATQRGVVHAVIDVGAGKPRKKKASKSKKEAAPPPLAHEGEELAELLTESKPRIHSAAPKDNAAAKVERVVSARRFLRRVEEPFELPSLSLLNLPPTDQAEVDEDELQRQARRLEETLVHYGVRGRVTDILPGPVVTMFEFEPEPGIKVSKIAGLNDDLAMALRAVKVRIVAPIPGKGAVGIEIPSPQRETVYFREILASKDFRKARASLPLALGKGIDGTPVCQDMAKMPHILVAGTTGSGKSVCVNTILLSLLFGKTPEQVRFILVDPKMLEFSIYDGIPHLLVPVVTSAKKAAVALSWAVREMERRYKVLSAMGVRNIAGYNARAEQLIADWETYEKQLYAGKQPDKPDCGRAPGEDTVCYVSRGDDPIGAPDKMPAIVIIIDELADLMMVARKEVEESIVRLAQMARAAGIHMLLATQRPSVDVITGLIKANFPTRLSFRVSSKVDSRTVLDANGAENLLGMGDGLLLPPGSSDLTRVHGAFVSDDEVQRIVDHLKSQGEPNYINAVLVDPSSEEDDGENDEALDEMYDQCVAVVAEAGKASTSLLQRRLKLGYNRAARIMDAMERRGVIGPQDGARPREVYARSYDD